MFTCQVRMIILMITMVTVAAMIRMTTTTTIVIRTATLRLTIIMPMIAMIIMRRRMITPHLTITELRMIISAIIIATLMDTTTSMDTRKRMNC
mmetsp:Transcript_11954/g.18837  ORF Transcript_11954/g.18837 Transcript_11954/m.18837 type:complete len:93 (+) Transcript_11954:592-870(+)